MTLDSRTTWTPSVSLDQLYQLAVEASEELLGAIVLRSAQSGSFVRTEQLLAALPLPQQRYAWATARLANARAYAVGGEWNAAAFEARLLARRLALESSLGGDAAPVFRYLPYALFSQERSDR